MKINDYNINPLVEAAQRYGLMYGPNEIFEKIQNDIIRTKKPYYIYLFAKGVEASDKELLSNEIAKYNIAEYIIDFARDVEGADIKVLQDAVVWIGDADAIYEFAITVPGADIKELSDAIIKTGNWNYMINIARAFPSELDAIQQNVIDSGNPDAILAFAQLVEGADLKALQEAIINTHNEQKILAFAFHLEAYISEDDYQYLIEQSKNLPKIEDDGENE